jgi:hypothetical protein
VSGQLYASAALSPKREPPVCIGWAPEPVWKFVTLPELKLRSSGRPVRSQSLYRLRYRGSKSVVLSCLACIHLPAAALVTCASAAQNGRIIQRSFQVTPLRNTQKLAFTSKKKNRSQWSSGLGHELFSPAPTLRSWVRISLRHGCLCVFCVRFFCFYSLK